MTRTSIFMLACYGGLALMLAACDMGESGKSGERQIAKSIVGPRVQNDSPREVVESLHNLAMDGHFKSTAKLFEPAQQEAMAVMLGAVGEMSLASESLRALVEERFGTEQAELVGGTKNDRSPFSKVVRVDGSLDWSRIQIKEDGDEAIIEIDGRPYSDPLVRNDGKWYMSSRDAGSPEEMMKQADESRVQAQKMIAALHKLEEGIRSGSVTKDNFHQEFLGAAFEALAGG